MRSSFRRRDDGAFQVWDAMLASMIIMATLASSIAMERPTFESSYVASMYRDGLRNFADTLMDLPLPTGTCGGATAMENYVIQGVNGLEAEWRQHVQRRFGEGVDIDLHLKNGAFEFPLAQRFDRPAIAGVTKSFRPAWEYAVPLAETTAVSGLERLIVDVYDVDGTRMVRPLGEAVRTTVTLDGALHDAQVMRTSLTAMPTLAHESDAQTRNFAQDLTWADQAGVPRLLHDLSPSEIALGAVVEVRLSLTPGLSGEPPASPILPTGLRTRIQLPDGWNPVPSEMTDANPKWSLAPIEGSITQGWTLTFDLQEDSTQQEIIRVIAHPPENPMRPFDWFHARLSNASLGESSLAITYPPSAERGFPLEARPTTPYPVRYGTRALFGVAVANGGDTATVRNVDIEIPGGYDTMETYSVHGDKGAALFANAPILMPQSTENPEPVNATGWKWIDARHLRWTGSQEILPGKAASWLVSVQLTDDLTQGTLSMPQHSDGYTSTLTFSNGYTHTSTRWGPTPGVIRHEVPPASIGENDGYPWALPTPPATSTSYSYDVRLEGYGTLLTNTSTYQVQAVSGDAVKTQRAIANSTFHVTDRTTPIGGITRADADIGSIAKELSTAGATSVKFTASLFPPSSMGCAPAATWSREIETLPRAAIRAAQLWDPLGGSATSMFITGDDKHVYKLDQASSVLWTRQLSGEGLFLEPAAFSPVDVGIFVADARGEVTRIDPVTGAQAWRVGIPRASWSGTKTPNPATSLAIEAATARVLAANDQGTLQLRAASTGALIASLGAPEQTRFTEARFDDAGRIYALEHGPAGTRLVRLTANAGALDEAASSPPGVLITGYSLTPVGVITAGGTLSHVLDPDTLSVDPAHAPMSLPGVVVLASHGDATGDTVADLVVALSDMRILTRDGTSGTEAWRHTVEGDPAHAVRLVDGFVNRGGGVCGPQDIRSEDGISYRIQPVCAAAPESPGVPLRVLADDGRVALSFTQNGIPHLALLDPSGVRWVDLLRDDQSTTALAMGEWLLQDALAIGLDDGTLYVRDTLGNYLTETTPTQFAGRFTFYLQNPRAGFYGTHVLTGTLSWRDAEGRDQLAQIVDWFEVVRPDGTAAGSERYELVLRLEDRSDTMVAGRRR